MKTIEIKELKEKLGYLDLRAVRSWCKKNNVAIIKYGKMEYVIEPNFEEAFGKALINKLKRQFGDDWISPYKLYEKRIIRVKRRHAASSLPDGISKNEFLKILEVITPENSNYQTPVGEQNLYKPWFKDAYSLGILTGARRSEIANFKWSDIKLKKDLPLSYFESFDRIENKNSKLLYRLTPQLKSKLIDLGYEENKDTDKYILAPSNSNRKEVSDLISKSFAHYTKLVGIDKEFISLRIAFIKENLNNNN